MPEETRPLANRVALVTGAGRGIGRAIAVRLARAGARSVLAARTEVDLQDTAERVRSVGSNALVIQTDVTKDQQLEALVDRTLSHYGYIDILVNNAGGGPPRTSIAKARPTDWEWTLRVNLWATMMLTKLVLPSMISRESGTIIMLGSHASLSGRAGESAYAAAKFGLRGFSQSLFEEVRERGIKVSLICPGYVDTALLPPNRRLNRSKLLSPEDVAEAVYSIALSPSRCCPAEIVLTPQYDPLK